MWRSKNGAIFACVASHTVTLGDWYKVPQPAADVRPYLRKAIRTAGVPPASSLKCFARQLAGGTPRGTFTAMHPPAARSPKSTCEQFLSLINGESQWKGQSMPSKRKLFLLLSIALSISIGQGCALCLGHDLFSESSGVAQSIHEEDHGDHHDISPESNNHVHIANDKLAQKSRQHDNFDFSVIHENRPRQLNLDVVFHSPIRSPLLSVSLLIISTTVLRI